MKQSPELMTRALNLHNAIIRKARWANFGYTVEQEGDSYSLVFYEALDAVIFCLQVGKVLGGSGWWAVFLAHALHKVHVAASASDRCVERRCRLSQKEASCSFAVVCAYLTTSFNPPVHPSPTHRPSWR